MFSSIKKCKYCEKPAGRGKSHLNPKQQHVLVGYQRQKLELDFSFQAADDLWVPGVFTHRLLPAWQGSGVFCAPWDPFSCQVLLAGVRAQCLSPARMLQMCFPSWGLLSIISAMLGFWIQGKISQAKNFHQVKEEEKLLKLSQCSVNVFLLKTIFRISLHYIPCSTGHEHSFGFWQLWEGTALRGQCVWALAAAATSPREHPATAIPPMASAELGLRLLARNNTQSSCIRPAQAGPCNYGRKSRFGKRSFRKSNFPWLLAARMFLPIPSPSRAAIEHAHANVCLQLNSECAHPGKMRRDPHAENGNLTFDFSAQCLVWMLLLIFFFFINAWTLTKRNWKNPVWVPFNSCRFEKIFWTQQAWS